MVEVRLIPMTKKEFEVMKEAGIKRYADENIKAGYWTPGEAVQRSKEAHDRLLPDGVRTEGHHFYKAVDTEDDKSVGQLWFRLEPGEDRRAFIFDVFINEDCRGHGYGKAMMKTLEAKAKRMKITALALHVFAYNNVALHLYESLGFEIKSLNMIKIL